MGIPWKIGVDPEFFLVREDDRSPVSAHDLLPGTKDAPHPLYKGALQVDGTAVEFNIEPARTAAEFKENIKGVLWQIRRMLDTTYRFQFSPTVQYPSSYFKTLPESAKELGCDPDYNAYTEQVNPNPSVHTKNPMRTASGDVHTGWSTRELDVLNPTHFSMCCKAARQQDSVLRVGSLFFGDDDSQRRKMYGKTGAFRPKAYGLEYRVMSNQWLRYDESIDWVFNTIKIVMDHLFEGTLLDKELSHLALIRSPTDFNRTMFNNSIRSWGIPPVPQKLTELWFNG